MNNRIAENHFLYYLLYRPHYWCIKKL